MHYKHKLYENGEKEFNHPIDLKVYTAQKLNNADIRKRISELFSSEEIAKQGDKKSEMEIKRSELKRELFKEFGFHDEAAMIEDEKLNMNKELYLKEISTHHLDSEENQIKYIINCVMKGIIDKISVDFGPNSLFGYHDDSKGEDGIYIIDKGACILKFSDESKPFSTLEKYDFFGPIGILREILKTNILSMHSRLNVIADTDEVKCIFVSSKHFYKIPLWERPIIKKAYEDIAHQYFEKHFK